jgi:hypothetical protein
MPLAGATNRARLRLVDEGFMKQSVDQQMATSSAATQQTEP